MPYFLYTLDDDGQDVFPLDLYKGQMLSYDYVEQSEELTACLATFSDRASAHAFKTETPNAPNGRPWVREIVFYCTADDRSSWTARELNRFGSDRSDAYMTVPWSDASWYCCGYYKNPDGTTTAVSNGRPTSQSLWVSALESKHYCHISTEKDEPGYVAYTPNDEYGTQNRKIRTTVARYLQQFAKLPDGSAALTTEEIAQYVERCKATLAMTFSIAETAAEVVKVYRNGPSSCMSHQTSSYETNGIHPVSIYVAPGDLRIAYLGTPEDVSARCVIWPERKIYGRSYGDTVIRRILEKAGYSREEMNGAKLPCIPLDGYGDDCYLMPYIDGIDCAELVTIDRQRFFVLGSGPYNVQETEGHTGYKEDAEDNYCEHCDGYFTDDDYYGDESMCRNCYASSWVCTQCSTRYFDDGEQNRYDGESYCDDCYGEYIRSCQADGCSNEWHKHEDGYRGSDKVDRVARGVDEFCNECCDGQRLCKNCNEFTPVEEDDAEQVCVECGARPLCANTLDLLTTGMERATTTPDGWKIAPDVRRAIRFGDLPIGARLYRMAGSLVAFSERHGIQYAQKVLDPRYGPVIWFDDRPIDRYQYDGARVNSTPDDDTMILAEVPSEVYANV